MIKGMTFVIGLRFWLDIIYSRDQNHGITKMTIISIDLSHQYIHNTSWSFPGVSTTGYV